MINTFHLVPAFDKAKPNLFYLKSTSVWYGVFIVGKAVNVFGQKLHGNCQYHFVLSMQPIHCHFCCCHCCFRCTILYYICILYCVLTPSEVSVHHHSFPPPTHSSTSTHYCHFLQTILRIGYSNAHDISCLAALFTVFFQAYLSLAMAKFYWQISSYLLDQTPLLINYHFLYHNI